MGAAGSKLEKALGEQFPRRNSELSVKELLARVEARESSWRTISSAEFRAVNEGAHCKLGTFFSAAFHQCCAVEDKIIGDCLARINSSIDYRELERKGISPWIKIQGAYTGARQLEVTINGSERAGNALLE
ncbi:putative 2-isopropylmalate synthase [Bienertia sinuspersici]